MKSVVKCDIINPNDEKKETVMRKYIDELMLGEGIELTGAISLSDCTVTRDYLLKKAGIADGTCIVFAIPYLSRSADTPARNISAYAVSRDYHLFVKQLSERLLPRLSERFPDNRFAFFADHSPIDERDAAVKCGIGSFGDNRLIINKKYSSFFFIGELITDAHLEADSASDAVCIHCGACKRICPMNVDGSDCLSAVTQKKGQLSDDEENLIRKYKCAWGCDLCQDACPVTLAARKSGSVYTEIPFFTEDTTPSLTEKSVVAMSDAEFSRRAFSWRGRSVILRNLSLLEDEEEIDVTKGTAHSSKGE